MTTTALTDRQKIARLAEALLRLMFGGTVDGRPHEGDGWDEANDALLAAGAYSFGQPHPARPNLVLREIDGGDSARTVELWTWNRWPNGWAGCRAEDEPACYFPADRWERVGDAPDFPAGPGPVYSSALTSQLTHIQAGAHCSTHGCGRSATHVLIAPDGTTVPGGMCCMPCARLIATEYLDKLGERWHAVVPASGRDPRDGLICDLLDRLDGFVTDLASHRIALREAREALAGVYGEAQGAPLALTHDGQTIALADWYRLSRGWFGRDTASGRDGFYSDTHWAAADNG